jgi:hypothetical protein
MKDLYKTIKLHTFLKEKKNLNEEFDTIMDKGKKTLLTECDFKDVKVVKTRIANCNKIISELLKDKDD